MTSFDGTYVIAEPPIEVVSRAPAEAVVARAQRGETAALRRLYELHAGRVHRFVADLCGPADAPDVTQETFARAFRRLDTLEDHDKIVPWILGIARRVAMELLRGRRRSRGVTEQGSAKERASVEPVDPHTPETLALHREAGRILHRALSELAPARRAALLLRVDHQLEYNDIAAAMGWSVAKARVEVHRGRRQLRSALDASQGCAR